MTGKKRAAADAANIDDGTKKIDLPILYSGKKENVK